MGKKIETTVVYWGYVEITKKKMETTIGLGVELVRGFSRPARQKGLSQQFRFHGAPFRTQQHACFTELTVFYHKLVEYKLATIHFMLSCMSAGKVHSGHDSYRRLGLCCKSKRLLVANPRLLSALNHPSLITQGLQCSSFFGL